MSSSVRSITSSTGMTAAGDADFEGVVVFLLGCAVPSSSSEEISYIVVRRKLLRRPYAIGRATVNPLLYSDSKKESDTSSSAS